MNEIQINEYAEARLASYYWYMHSDKGRISYKHKRGEWYQCKWSQLKSQMTVEAEKEAIRRFLKLVKR